MITIIKRTTNNIQQQPTIFYPFNSYNHISVLPVTECFHQHLLNYFHYLPL